MSEFVLLLPEILKFIIASQTPWDEESTAVSFQMKAGVFPLLFFNCRGMVMICFIGRNYHSASRT